MPASRWGGVTLLALLAAAAAEAQPETPRGTRLMSLAEAVKIAMAVDPLIAEAHINEERGKLAVLRSQLDRVSLRLDGQLQELWNKSNIGGAQIAPISLCTVGPFTSQADPAACRAAGGSIETRTIDSSPQSFQGLFNLSANLNLPLFSGFRVSSTVKRAELLRDQAGHSIQQLRRDTALAVARAYWTVRRFDLLGAVRAASIERMREGERVAEGREKIGLAPPIDRNRARSQRLQQEASLADVAGAARESAAQLAAALGIPEQLALTDAPSLPLEEPPSIERLLADARGARQEIQIARLQLDAQHQTVRIVRSGFFPQLSAFGLFQLGNNPLVVGAGNRSVSSSANPFSNITGNLTVGASLQMNFFDTLATWTAHRDARYEEARLDEERRRSERLVESEVRVAHARLQRLLARRTPLVEADEVARDNLKIITARYQNGDSPVADLLQGQIDLNSVEEQLADLTAQLQLAWIELDAAQGRIPGVTP